MTDEAKRAFEILPPDQLDDITLWHTELLFIGSPNCRVEIVKGRVQFKGYLSKFEPSDMVDSEEPVASVTMRIVP